MEERRPVETIDVETCTAALHMTVDLTHILLLLPGGHDPAAKIGPFPSEHLFGDGFQAKWVTASRPGGSSFSLHVFDLSSSSKRSGSLSLLLSQNIKARLPLSRSLQSIYCSQP
jgi:hypothetical protein